MKHGSYSATLPQHRLSIKAQVTCILRRNSLGKNYKVALRLEAGRCRRVCLRTRLGSVEKKKSLSVAGTRPTANRCIAYLDLTTLLTC